MSAFVKDNDWVYWAVESLAGGMSMIGVLILFWTLVLCLFPISTTFEQGDGQYYVTPPAEAVRFRLTTAIIGSLVKPGMTRDQVEAVLGRPALYDTEIIGCISAMEPFKMTAFYSNLLVRVRYDCGNKVISVEYYRYYAARKH